MTKTQGTAFCSVTELLRADKHRLHKVTICRQRSTFQSLRSQLYTEHLRTIAQAHSEVPNVIRQEFDGRTVTVLGHQDKIYAFDAMCFHFGGPLGAGGDIEEIGNRPVISCPWHHQKVGVMGRHGVLPRKPQDLCMRVAHRRAY